MNARLFEKALQKGASAERLEREEALALARKLFRDNGVEFYGLGNET